MKISNLVIKNFKTFKDVSVNLNDLNVIIGGCASGKSNFVEVFKFLKEISQDFSNAVINHGGVYLKNFNLIKDEPTFIKIKFCDNDTKTDKFASSSLKMDISENILIQFREVIYDLKVNFNSFNHEILNENIQFNFDVYKCDDKNEKHKLSNNSLYLKNDFGNIYAKLKNKEKYFTVDDLVPRQLLNIVKNNFKNNNIPLINSPLSSVPIPWGLLFKDIVYYDFNPKFSKNITEINGNNKLKEFGENLSIPLTNILEDKDKKRLFLNLLNDLLPYIEDIDVDELSEKQRIYSIIEKYNNIKIPSLIVSDGTTNLVALIIALYFEEGLNILIEEPEKNIHPELLSKITQMIYETSKNKQVIITTHNPEILKNVSLDDIYYIYRDSNGFSNISKPINNDIFKEFIKELGIGEVFVDDYFRRL